MRVLGIETSCDETAVAIVEAPAGSAPGGLILANVVYSQQTEHRRFGGVMAAKGLAFARQKPFLAINHLEGHALTVRLTEQVDFPYLLLLVSGGHCQLLTVRGPGDFTRLGTTIDDAVGECFDKTAKLLGLGFPGGPAVERLAKDGEAQRFPLPRPMWRKPGCDFSFSGLKTAVRQAVEKLDPDDQRARADLFASFQRTLRDGVV